MSSLISIVTPVYNTGSLLLELYQSLVEQSYTNFEWIIVNDGSDDQETLQILNRIEKTSLSITRVDTQNNGAPAARNAGMQLAKGTYIKFLDADDLLPQNHLKEQIKAYDVQKDISNVIIASPVYVMKDQNDEKTIISKNSIGKKFISAPLLKSLIMFEFHHSGCLFPISLFKNNSEIYWDESLKACQDLDLLWRIMLQGASFTRCNSTFFINREHNYTDRITQSQSPEKWYSRFKVIENLHPKLDCQKYGEQYLKNLEKRANRYIIFAFFEMPAVGIDLYRRKIKLFQKGLSIDFIVQALKLSFKKCTGFEKSSINIWYSSRRNKNGSSLS